MQIICVFLLIVHNTKKMSQFNIVSRHNLFVISWQVYDDNLVVGLATAIAILDVFFILVAVPESLPEKLRLSSSWSAHISWEQADPFSVRRVTSVFSLLVIFIIIFAFFQRHILECEVPVSTLSFIFIKKLKTW